MARPAVFFDRDNTLIACDGYLGDPAGVKLVDGAADAIARARALGFATVVVSNQSGVARGMYDEDAVHAVNARMVALLREANPSAIIDLHEFCPFHPEATVDRYRQESDLRKPKPGMLLKAAKQLGLDLAKSWVVGDAPRDIDAGRAVGCRTVLVKDAALPPSPAAEAAQATPPDFTVSSLKEAAEVLERETPAAPAAAVTVAPMPSPPPRPAEPAPKTSAEPAKNKAPATNSTSAPDARRVEDLLGQILQELRHSNEGADGDFSVPKLFSGIVQVLALAAMFFAYLNRDKPSLDSTLLLALVLQTLTIALLLMGRQR